MAKVAVVYWSGTGNTEKMSEYVKDGITGTGAEADVYAASEFNAKRASEYAKIAFGCPSMGNEVLEEDEFEPMFRSLEGQLGGKTLALFGSYGWGDGEWMRTWESRCKGLGANLVSEGVIANEVPDNAAADECRKLGTALASS
ncbi:MAG: flavodoxin [Candidatus Methanoplasma sp.]|nr:flavodoxin [Candidatus Methanoplasma sp.]